MEDAQLGSDQGGKDGADVDAIVRCNTTSPIVDVLLTIDSFVRDIVVFGLGWLIFFGLDPFKFARWYFRWVGLGQDWD